MNKENYFFVNGQKGFDPSKGGLWSHWPIPAARVLMHNKEMAALRVLTCLITHLGYGKSANMAWPTLVTLSEESGMGKGKVQEGIKSLILFGFIQKHKKRHGRYWKNEYEILTACYKYQDMNEHAQQRLPSRLVRVVPSEAANKLQITPAIIPPTFHMQHEAIDYSQEDPFNIW